MSDEVKQEAVIQLPNRLERPSGAYDGVLGLSYSDGIKIVEAINQIRDYLSYWDTRNDSYLTATPNNATDGEI